MHLRHRGLVDHIRTGCVDNDGASYLDNSLDPGDDGFAYNDNHEHCTNNNVFRQHNHSDNAHTHYDTKR
jgi:hypothetical protein